MEKIGALRKAVVFTESRRTQEYLRNFLEANGYAGRIVLFNGTNTGPDVDRMVDPSPRRNEDNAVHRLRTPASQTGR